MTRNPKESDCSEANEEEERWWNAAKDIIMDNDLEGMIGDAEFERAAPIFSKQELLEDEVGTLLFVGFQLTSLGEQFF